MTKDRVPRGGVSLGHGSLSGHWPSDLGQPQQCWPSRSEARVGGHERGWRGWHCVAQWERAILACRPPLSQSYCPAIQGDPGGAPSQADQSPPRIRLV